MRSITPLFPLLLTVGCSEYAFNGSQPEIGVPAPEIVVTPKKIDFGVLPAGDTASGFFLIENRGDATLELGDLIVDGSLAFALTTEASGASLEPGDTADGMVVFTASGGEESGTVRIPSNDESNPEETVKLTGGTEVVTDKPVAICEVDPPEIEAIHGSADLIGDQSFDPNGLTLTYVWTGTLRPAGSQAFVPAGAGGDPNRYGFVADMVGTYGFELVVTNTDGVSSDPCYVELDAIPAEDLWVEMFWAHSGDDMDLHLTRAGGALTSTQDCYYANCVGAGRDWGAAGNPGNAVLDLDDIPGTGPENINVTSPENVVYNVYVHDYPGSVYNAANAVTVNIYLSGSLAWTDTRDIAGENDYVQFADVDWTARTVTPR